MCVLYLNYTTANQHLTMHLTMYEYGIYFWRGSAASSLPYTTEYKETNEPSHTMTEAYTMYLLSVDKRKSTDTVCDSWMCRWIVL